MDAILINKVRYYLLGSCHSEQDAENAFEITNDELMDAVQEADIDRCSCCGWWHETCELNDNDGDLVCEDCESDDEFFNP